MQIDTNDVLEAAATKWNFFPFKPGLVGGHCISVDPYFLSHKATELGYKPEVILSGRNVNDSIPRFITQKVVKLMRKKKILIKELSKQLEQLKFRSILENNSKNIIQDVKINNISVRFQKVDDLPPKELRKLVDAGKKELKTGIVIVFASLEDKVGLAVGITDELIDKYDAVTFAKTGSEIIGGKGGGGRKDFAQAGGQFKDKIDEAFEKIKTLI